MFWVFENTAIDKTTQGYYRRLETAQLACETLSLNNEDFLYSIVEVEHNVPVNFWVLNKKGSWIYTPINTEPRIND